MATVTNDYRIDSLLYGDAYRMNSDAAYGTATTVSYAFLTAPPEDASAADAYGFAAMDQTQQDLTRQALAKWSEVANVGFVETGAAEADIRFGVNDQGSTSSAYTITWGEGALVYLSSRSWSGGDSWDRHVLLHEIGHALGLKHPGNYNAGGGQVPGPYLTGQEDSTRYTVMSYSAVFSGVYPETPMLYDLLAVQFLYGARQDVRGGSTRYAFDGSHQQTIWDTGGDDTLDASGLGQGAVLDLREGRFSSMGATDNIAIGFGVAIENARGSEHDDSLAGNDLANGLEGLAGNDTIAAGHGDRVDGGAGADTVTLSAGGSVSIAAVESVAGSAQADAIVFAAAATATVSAVETLFGSAGYDWITLGDANGGALLVSGVEVLGGGSGADALGLGDGGNTIFLVAVETLAGGSGGDAVTTGKRGSTMTVSGIETLSGGAGNDAVVLGAAATISLAGIEAVAGSAGADRVLLAGGTGKTILSAVETVIGGSGGQWLQLGDGGTVVAEMSGIETLGGGSGLDAVALGDGGNTVFVVAIETLTGGSGADAVGLGNRGNTITVSGVETLAGGAGLDAVILGAAATMTLGGIEMLGGSSGADAVTLLGAAGKTILWAVETVAGDAGGNWVQLGDGNVSLALASGIETIGGGSGLDAVALGDGGNTVFVVAVETLAGGSGVDVVRLGNRGNTVTVSGVEILAGGSGHDVVTLSAGTAETVVYGTADDATDHLAGFSTAADRIALAGALRAAVDDDGDGVLRVAVRAGGAVDMGGSEAVILGGTVGTLDDGGYAGFRTALGALANSSAGADLLVLAGDGSNGGLYLVTDADGDGLAAAGEVRLLTVVAGAVLTGGNLAVA